MNEQTKALSTIKQQKRLERQIKLKELEDARNDQRRHLLNVLEKYPLLHRYGSGSNEMWEEVRAQTGYSSIRSVRAVVAWLKESLYSYRMGLNKSFLFEKEARYLNNVVDIEYRFKYEWFKEIIERKQETMKKRKQNVPETDDDNSNENADTNVVTSNDKQLGTTAEISPNEGEPERHKKKKSKHSKIDDDEIEEFLYIDAETTSEQRLSSSSHIEEKEGEPERHKNKNSKHSKTDDAEIREVVDESFETSTIEHEFETTKKKKKLTYSNCNCRKHEEIADEEGENEESVPSESTTIREIRTIKESETENSKENFEDLYKIIDEYMANRNRKEFLKSRCENQTNSGITKEIEKRKSMETAAEDPAKSDQTIRVCACECPPQINTEWGGKSKKCNEWVFRDGKIIRKDVHHSIENFFDLVLPKITKLVESELECYLGNNRQYPREHSEQFEIKPFHFHTNVCRNPTCQ